MKNYSLKPYSNFAPPPRMSTGVFTYLKKKSGFIPTRSL
jgi:hypothetical protein